MTEKNKKIKILTLSDHPLSPSGVGTQTRYMIESLLETGKYQFVSLGGAIKHKDYNPITLERWKDDWRIFPIDGYGTPEIVRSVIRGERPDILWFMTDPRFWGWLWDIENEVRPVVPMVYYHVWDNYPYPNFNKSFYDSNDAIVTISKVTKDIVDNVSPDVSNTYIPHAVDTQIFKKLEAEKVAEFRKKSFNFEEDKFVFFWNNRNARRKQSGSLIFWFKKFLDKVGHDKACLLMHTEPKDPNGQDLEAIVSYLGLTNGEVLFSRQKFSMEDLALLYNSADCTINVSDAEGFGLATLESLACETPIIVNMTGGLQEQVTDGEAYFGIALEPVSKAIIGSQEIPYIFEDRLSEEVVVEALEKMYNMSESERSELGKMGRQHVLNKFNFESFGAEWDKTLSSIHEKNGSWGTRKNYKSWEFKEVK